MKESTKIDSVLVTRATAELAAEIQKELSKEDPDPETVKAVINDNHRTTDSRR